MELLLGSDSVGVAVPEILDLLTQHYQKSGEPIRLFMIADHVVRMAQKDLSNAVISKILCAPNEVSSNIGLEQNRCNCTCNIENLYFFLLTQPSFQLQTSPTRSYYHMTTPQQLSQQAQDLRSVPDPFPSSRRRGLGTKQFCPWLLSNYRTQISIPWLPCLRQWLPGYVSNSMTIVAAHFIHRQLGLTNSYSYNCQVISTPDIGSYS